MVKSSNRVYPNMQRLSSNALSSTFFLVFKIRYPIVSEEQINLIGTGIGRHLLGKAAKVREERPVVCGVVCCDNACDCLAQPPCAASLHSLLVPPCTLLVPSLYPPCTLLQPRTNASN